MAGGLINTQLPAICFFITVENGIIIIAVNTNPVLLLIGALLAGFSCNACFALSMAFIGFRTKNAKDTAQLSSMSQTVGYLIAAGSSTV